MGFDPLQRGEPGAGFPAIIRRVVAAAACCILASCNFINDLNKPFEYTTVAFRGIVLDSVFHTVIPGAQVALDGGGGHIAADSLGGFSLTGVHTGMHRLTVSAPRYHSQSRDIDLTIDMPPDTELLTRENAKPVILWFTPRQISTSCIDDTVRFIFTITDSTGGVQKTLFSPGKGSVVDEQVLNTRPVLVTDTAKFIYGTSGLFTARLVAVGANADTAIDSVMVTVPGNRRPEFVMIRPSADGFINGEWGFIEVYVTDPDNNFNYMTINWGDTSVSEKSSDTASAHWHKYAFTNDTTARIAIRLIDNLGASADTIFSIQTRNYSAPLLDDNIVFNPSAILTPEDTSVFIGVKVLTIDGSYVSDIIWIINQEDPATVQSVRKNYTNVTGAITSIGNVFAMEFSTAKLKATNEIQIIVRDHLGKTSSVVGQLYVAGKAN